MYIYMIYFSWFGVTYDIILSNICPCLKPLCFHPPKFSCTPNSINPYNITYVLNSKKCLSKQSFKNLMIISLPLLTYYFMSSQESIRRGHDDLGDHFLDFGDLGNALKCYSRARSANFLFCKKSQFPVLKEGCTRGYEFRSQFPKVKLDIIIKVAGYIYTGSEIMPPPSNDFFFSFSGTTAPLDVTW